MQQAYRILSATIAALVVVQAMTIVFAVAGLFHWVEAGGTLDQSAIEAWEDDQPSWQGAIGYLLHSEVGAYLIPSLALILLILSLLTRVLQAVLLSGVILVSVVAQVLLGMMASGTPQLGLLHGLNAFILFAASLWAARTMPPGSASRRLGGSLG